MLLVIGVQLWGFSAYSKTLSPILPSSSVLPFGASLFSGGQAANAHQGLNRDYRVAVGDSISLWLWGAVSLKEVSVVDAKGHIFIPDVGPVRVQGVRVADLSSVVAHRVRQVYTQGVELYVNVLSSTPVSVFVTGPVVRPGQYAGFSSDSVMSYLVKSGGIVPNRGSYRHIQIKRRGQIVARYDLYGFLRNGQLLRHQFQDQDVILVSEQGPTVRVMSGARQAFQFELLPSGLLGADLLPFARPLPSVSHVRILGTRSSGPYSVYVPMSQFSKLSLVDGDSVFFEADQHAKTLNVSLSGAYLGPSFYTLKKGIRLRDFLAFVPISLSESNVKSVYLLRKSVATQQKNLLKTALDRLERNIYTVPVSSDGEAQIRRQEAALVSEFIARGRALTPDGKVVVSNGEVIGDVVLEPDDIVVIPPISDVVNVAGEVMLPQGVVVSPNGTLRDYVNWAGGVTARGDWQRIALVKANGFVTFDQSAVVQGGDSVVVMPKFETKNMQFAKDLTQILYQIAVAAKVIF